MRFRTKSWFGTKWYNMGFYTQINFIPLFSGPHRSEQNRVTHYAIKNTRYYRRVFAKSRLRFGLQVPSKAETKSNFDFKRVTKSNFGFKGVCEEQSANFSVFDRKKLSFEIQIFL